MTKDDKKTKKQLLEEIQSLRRQVAGLRTLKARHKRMVGELRKKEAFASSIIDGMTDMVVVIDPDDFRILSANKAYLEKEGLSEGDIVGKTCYGVTHRLSVPCSPPHHTCPLYETVRTGKIVTEEHIHYDKNGEEYYAEITTAPLFDDEKKLLQILHVSRDITERRRAQQALLESEEKFRSISALAKDAIIMVDDGDGIVYWNTAAEKIFGYQRKEAVGEKLYRLIIPDRFRESHLKGFKKFRDTGQGSVIGKTLELTAIRRDGTEFPVELSISAVKLKGRWDAIGIIRDITERKRMEEIIKHMAYHDTLTQLPNRKLFMDRLSIALSHARRSGEMVVVMFLDLDKFKEVNDTLGHDAGDQLLKDAAGRLKRCIREGDTVARLGGDEFTLLLTEIRHTDDAMKIAGKILEVIRQPFMLDGRKCCISTSIGIALYPRDGSDAEILMKRADAAMYHAKEQGRDNYRFYDAVRTPV